MRLRPALLVFYSCIWAAACQATEPTERPDWNRFRGPQGHGVSPARDLPTQFGPTQNLRWKVPVGPGHSSPIYSRDRVFLTAGEDDQLVILCWDGSSGRLLWRRTLPPQNPSPLGGDNNPASPSPVSDGERAYFFFQDFGLIAFTHQGEEVWRLPLGPFNNFYGMASSPIVVGDLLILQADQDTDSFLMAVDKLTGQVRWKTDRPRARSGYSTPTHFPAGDQEVLLVASSFELAGYRLEDGSKQWSVLGLPWQIKALPVVGDGRIFINGAGVGAPGLSQIPRFTQVASTADLDLDGLLAPSEVPPALGRDWFAGIDADRDGHLNQKEWEFFRQAIESPGGLLAYRLGPDPGTAPELDWEYRRSVPDIASILLYHDRLYMIGDGGILMVLDPATGRLVKRLRLKNALDRYFASPVAGDGKIYFTSAAGTITALAAGEEVKILATNPLEEPTYATPALTSGRIYVRTAKHLYCFSHLGPGG